MLCLQLSFQMTPRPLELYMLQCFLMLTRGRAVHIVAFFFKGQFLMESKSGEIASFLTSQKHTDELSLLCFTTRGQNTFPMVQRESNERRLQRKVLHDNRLQEIRRKLKMRSQRLMMIRRRRDDLSTWCKKHVTCSEFNVTSA